MGWLRFSGVGFSLRLRHLGNFGPKAEKLLAIGSELKDRDL